MDSLQLEGIESRHPAVKGDSKGRDSTSLKPKKGRPRIDAQSETAAEVRHVYCFRHLD